MSGSKRKKLKDLSILGASKREEAESVEQRVSSETGSDKSAKQMNPKGSGLYGTSQLTRELNYSASPSEKIIEHNGSFITLGGDKPSGTASGKGGIGAPEASRIDLVVGRLSSAKPRDGSNVDNSFQADAARIYISQLTDIDLNFGIDPGKSGRLTDRSGIGIKADGVRIIGREGVKIVTGRMQNTDEKNSVGGKLLPAPTIELIAGNNSEPRKIPGSALSGDEETYDPLQGVAMGYNVVRAFQDLLFLLQDVVGVIRKDKNNQKIFNFAMASAAALPEPAAAAVASAAQAYFQVKDTMTAIDLWQSQLDATMFDINYLQPFGYRYLESRNVKAT